MLGDEFYNCSSASQLLADKIVMKKLYYLVLVAGVVMISVALFRKGGDSANTANIMEGIEQDTEEDTEEDNVGENVDESTKDATENMMTDDDSRIMPSAGESFLEGVLQRSEDETRGNYKLVSGESDIYLKTSRDFSSLVGFQVLVIINGSRDNFELVDIQSRVAKDGYIRQ